MKIPCRILIFLLPFFINQRASAQTGMAPPGPELVAGAGLLSIDRGEKQWLASADWRFSSFKWNIRPWLGAAFAERGTWFLSAGVIYTLPMDSGWRMSVGFAPTDYRAGNGKFLGESLEFYSFAEAGYVRTSGQVFNLRFGHISNAHLASYNPGTEVLMLSWSVPFH